MDVTTELNDAMNPGPSVGTTLRMPEPNQKRLKINALLQEILPGSTTLAEMELVSDNIFAMVESWWTAGSVLKRQIPVPKPPVMK